MIEAKRPKPAGREISYGFSFSEDGGTVDNDDAECGEDLSHLHHVVLKKMIQSARTRGTSCSESRRVHERWITRSWNPPEQPYPS